MTRITATAGRESSSQQIPEDMARSVSPNGRPTRAARLFDDAERTAQFVTYERSQTEALAHIARAVAAIDPDRAVFDDAERAVQSITDEGSKSETLAKIVKDLAVIDPATMMACSSYPARRPRRSSRWPRRSAMPSGARPNGSGQVSH
jgi:hypothetical protein